MINKNKKYWIKNRKYINFVNKETIYLTFANVY